MHTRTTLSRLSRLSFVILSFSKLKEVVRKGGPETKKVVQKYYQ